MKRRWRAGRVAAVTTLAVAGFALAAFASGAVLATGTTTESTGSTGSTDTTSTTSTTPPEGGQGCTPGFWRNHTGAWVGYLPGQTVGSVFAIGGSLGSATLLDALSFGGGSTLDDAKALLIHHAVAALLNAANPDVDYAFTTAEIIAWTNDLLASSDRDAILALKDLFDSENNSGCPL
jgi:hypothetical protein